ncbi:MAG: glycerophosphodiester phosphodiesterase family protein, partial [Roseobacter sp.]|nr:glycerophosphodiester phosphodiesterase family protein [Roseobacter sp.]
MLRTSLYLTALMAALPVFAQSVDRVEYGPRPYYLIDQMRAGPLKDKLLSCSGQDASSSLFSIGHRGAPMQFPEHTVESNLAAARMGAGILECDVTFTKDLELVCRHAQNDLHTTTNILATPLASSCAKPFTPATGETPASAECRTSEITLAEYRTLTPKMDAADKSATTIEAYMGGTADWRTDLYSVEPA